MDYARFVRLQEPACEEFEARLEGARRRPKGVSYEELEELAIRYRMLLHTYALAETRFPGTAMTRRLRALALEGTHWLHRDRGEHLPGPIEFFWRRFPKAVQSMAPTLVVFAATFGLAVLFGMALTAADPAVAGVFLSPAALQELRDGTLWTESIFAVVPGGAASSLIATNNLTVAIGAWAGGILAGLGALYVLLLNGLMLGSVVMSTAHFGMAGPLLEFIAAHGPLELTLIVLCAAAGAEIGRAWVVAGDRPRAERLASASRRALVVLLGCLPWIVAAALVEGFVSPSVRVPPAAKASVGLLLVTGFLAVAWRQVRDEPPER